MLASGVPQYLSSENVVVSFHGGGGNRSQNTYLKHIQGHTSQEPFPRMKSHEEKGSSSDFMWTAIRLATATPSFSSLLSSLPCGPSLSQDLHVVSYLTTQATTFEEDTIQKIEMLAQTAGKENWDGEGAIKVSPETIEIARKFVATFPPNVLSEDLDIDATPFGSIDFGWVLERDVMMNIIVLPSGEIGFAYSVHGTRGGGKEQWEGTTIPLSVSEAFDKVFNRHGFGD